jgi:hypothetical protein
MKKQKALLKRLEKLEAKCLGKPLPISPTARIERIEKQLEADHKTKEQTS